jgi:DNA-binding MarR family transcriptional regulator
MVALADDLGFLLSRGSGLVARASNEALAAVGLRVRPYSVLALACDSGEGMSQRALARTLGLDPSQVVQLVDELVDAELVERRPAPADRRTRLVAATAAGRRLRDEAARLAEGSVKVAVGALSAAEQEALRSLLVRVVHPALA